MADNPVAQLVSAVQSASIKRDPSPRHDINPSTAASEKIPADLASPPDSISDDASISSDIVDPQNVIRPRPRQATFPPLPDFRFEQSYLASIKQADTWWQVAYITMKDQVVFPLVQGTGYALLLHGWRHWNSGTKLHGNAIGAKVRRWWYQVNNWEIPRERSIQRQGLAKDVKELTTNFLQFYVDEFSNAGAD